MKLQLEDHMKLQLTILSIGIVALSAINAHAQDLHFSQYFNSPLTVNPANTGFIPDADYRLGVQYRNQWSALVNAPYKTMTAFADAQVFRDRLENGWLGLGAVVLSDASVVLSDAAGSGNLRSTKVYGSVAYHQMLGFSSLLSAGFNIGYANKRVDPSKLTFPDQFNGEFFESGLPTQAVFSNTSTSYFDLHAGINYAYFPQENVYINAGYSISHVNKPRETFFNNQSENGIIPMRHIGFVNAILKLNDQVIISPNAYFSIQSKATELQGGVPPNCREVCKLILIYRKPEKCK